MILSNVEILQALENGWLKIDPVPEPRKPTLGKDCPYQTSAVDLRMGNEISWVKPNMPIVMDLRSGGLVKLLANNCQTITITEEQPFALQPNRFVLAKTYETIGLPVTDKGSCLAARVEGRSSYARCGLLVHFTAPTIHAGFEGTITLEIMNLGVYPINLYPLTPICQLIVEQVAGIPFRNESQFHGQAAAVGRIAG